MKHEVSALSVLHGRGADTVSVTTVLSSDILSPGADIANWTADGRLGNFDNRV